MLQKILIKNIALIDNLEIDFSKGLNILTGETGAGKSIIIDAIGVVLGDRVSKELIRTGQESGYVEAFFEINPKIAEYLKENQLEENDDIFISREFNKSGKNVCRINGRVVNAGALKEIGQMLIDIHGQNDNQSLLNVAAHIDLLDSFGKEKIEKTKLEYIEIFNKRKEIIEKINKLGGDENQRERKLDLLKFQIDEVEGANLKIGEDLDLEDQKRLISNQSKIAVNIEQSYDYLYSGSSKNSIVNDLSNVMKNLEAISQYDHKINSLLGKAQDIYYNLEDLVEELREYKGTLDFDPNSLEIIEERLDNINKLKRKYGQSIEEILTFKDELLDELQELQYSEELLSKYNDELNILNSQIEEKAKALSKERKTVASLLEEKVVKELEDLEMKKTTFKVNFEAAEYNAKGIDKVEFLISPNAGEALKPLSKIASGGEMSRIMLAIKTILAKVDQIPVLIFDEIDNGVSGKAADMVGQKLSLVSKNHQVLCITHLPQIASIADSHYLIEKYTENSKTRTTVKELNKDERMYEIARIMGGVEITDTTLQHAKEMLEMAQGKKSS